MTIRSAFRIATAVCAVSLVIALTAVIFSSALTVPATILVAMAGAVPLVLFVAGTVARGPVWDEEVDAARLIEEIMSSATDHSPPGSRTERPRAGTGEDRESQASEPLGWNIPRWPAAGAHAASLQVSE